MKWIDNAKDHFTLTVESFCKWVKEYLDKKGKNHRIIFLVDEVGQFIGGDTHLMLNLQTITEELGTICNGRAGLWSHLKKTLMPSLAIYAPPSLTTSPRFKAASKHGFRCLAPMSMKSSRGDCSRRMTPRLKLLIGWQLRSKRKATSFVNHAYVSQRRHDVSSVQRRR